nr:MAG TPA: hypothetical protein [Caudoviricetes sp.]
MIISKSKGIWGSFFSSKFYFRYKFSCRIWYRSIVILS